MKISRKTFVTFCFSKKRPFVPQTIHDVHLNDIVKFSRPEGKVSKGLVKYIGSLPDRTDHYLGLELDEEGKLIDNISIILCVSLFQIVNTMVFSKDNDFFNGKRID